MRAQPQMPANVLEATHRLYQVGVIHRITEDPAHKPVGCRCSKGDISQHPVLLGIRAWVIREDNGQVSIHLAYGVGFNAVRSSMYRAGQSFLFGEPLSAEQARAVDEVTTTHYA